MTARLISRRAALIGTAVGLLGVNRTFAQSAGWRPTRLVRLIVPQAAGGYSDVMARLYGAYLQEHIGQTVVIENKVGGAGTLGSVEVAKADPDGHTLLMGNSASQAVAYSLVRNIPYKDSDLTPVCCIIRGPNALIANPSIPAQNIHEFIALLKSNPGKYNFGTPGYGTTPHLAGVWFNSLLGTDSVAVHYKGSPAALTDLYAGRVQYSFDALSNVAQQVQAQKVKIFGLTGAQTVPGFESAPVLHAAVPELKTFVTESWVGLFAPKGTAAPIVEYYNRQAQGFLSQAGTAERFAKLGGLPAYSSASEFERYDTDEIKKWAAVTKSANLSIEN